jgi:3-dehydroquinate synthase
MNVREVPVRLGARSYTIAIGEGALDGLSQRLGFARPGTQVAVVTSPTVAGLYGDTVVGSLVGGGFDAWVAEIPDGEQHKTLATTALLYDQFVERRMDRGSLVIALGGGVVGDVAGFAAATYMRGVGFVQLPTTLIAQVDSSVGGKVGVDHRRGKNLIGAFHQPRLVVADVETLRTLPERQFRAGIAEVVRYAVIASPSLFTTLETDMDVLLSRDGAFLTAVIAECCAIKARIVEEDETETGVRATLNYGHTFAHAIEAVTHYERLLHGEAVAIGMTCAAEMARAQGLVDRAFSERQRAILTSAGLPTSCPSDVDSADVVAAMSWDKKAVGGRVRFIVLDTIGHVAVRDDFSAEQARRAVESTR